MLFPRLQGSSSGLQELLKERPLWTLQIPRPARLSWTQNVSSKPESMGMSRTSFHTRPRLAIYKRDFLTEISAMWAQECCSS